MSRNQVNRRGRLLQLLSNGSSDESDVELFPRERTTNKRNSPAQPHPKKTHIIQHPIMDVSEDSYVLDLGDNKKIRFKTKTSVIGLTRDSTGEPEMEPSKPRSPSASKAVPSMEYSCLGCDVDGTLSCNRRLKGTSCRACEEKGPWAEYCRTDVWPKNAVKHPERQFYKNPPANGRVMELIRSIDCTVMEACNALTRLHFDVNRAAEKIFEERKPPEDGIITDFRTGYLDHLPDKCSDCKPKVSPPTPSPKFVQNQSKNSVQNSSQMSTQDPAPMTPQKMAQSSIENIPQNSQDSGADSPLSYYSGLSDILEMDIDQAFDDDAPVLDANSPAINANIQTTDDRLESAVTQDDRTASSANPEDVRLSESPRAVLRGGNLRGGNLHGGILRGGSSGSGSMEGNSSEDVFQLTSSDAADASTASLPTLNLPVSSPTRPVRRSSRHTSRSGRATKKRRTNTKAVTRFEDEECIPESIYNNEPIRTPTLDENGIQTGWRWLYPEKPPARPRGLRLAKPRPAPMRITKPRKNRKREFIHNGDDEDAMDMDGGPHTPTPKKSTKGSRAFNDCLPSNIIHSDGSDKPMTRSQRKSQGSA